MSEKHYCGYIGEVEYVRLKQPNMSSETYYTKEYVEKLQQRIAELEEQLKNAIVPKFNRQEHICGFAFGEIREYIVVGYLDNNITLCENILTDELEWCDNNFLVRTFEEALAKLEELKGE